ncbi:hypothetical protein [Methylobacterium sp. A54F]
MSQRVGAAVTVDPTAYVALFEGGRPVPGALAGVCGRVVRGKSEAEFTMLAFASGRRLAWVTGPAGLRSMIGRSGAKIVLGIGKDAAWLREKVVEGMGWRLVVLPQSECARADWAGVFAMVEVVYPEVARKLLRWRDAIRDQALVAKINPALVSGAVKDDAGHPDHMSVARYEACSDTAANARVFLWHTLGLNQHFTGDGWATDPLTRERVEEYLTANVPLAEIAGHRVIALDVSP